MAWQWKTARRTLALGKRPSIMGILNVTPDSFSDGGLFFDPTRAVEHALKLEAEGADLIDIGAESTRPGAEPVDEAEEKRRLWPILEALQGKITLPISVDTTKAAVAAGALERGAEIINDISGGRFDGGLWPLVARTGAGYVLMHSRGTPKTMHQETEYRDVVAEVVESLTSDMERAIAAGIAPEQIIVDPGFGFAKTAEQNLQLLAGIGALAELERPVLIGLSRKSFLKRIAGEGALQVCTTAAEMMAAAALPGGRLWRTHDVAAARAAALLLEAVLSTDHESLPT